MVFIFGFFFLFPLIVVPFIHSLKRYFEYEQWLKAGRPAFQPINDYSPYLEAPEKLPLSYKKWKYNWEYPELLFMGIAPILGSIFIYIFKSDIHPFGLESSPTLIVYVLITFCSYWISRLFKERLPAAVNLILPYGMLLGCALYAVLFVHFISGMTVLGGLVLPVFAFPLYAPLPALLYNIRQIKQHNLFAWHQNVKLWESFAQSSPKRDLFRNLWWHEGFPNPVFLMGLVITIQCLLQLAGQPFDAIFDVFTHSKDFFFSNVNGSYL